MGYSEVLKKWKDSSRFYEIQTSGSTGAPKSIKLEKSKMRASALMSLKYFDLQQQQSVLLALPTNKIGGVMLCIRAIIGHLQVVEVEPRLNPIEHIELPNIDFCSLTPAQLTAILNNESSRSKLKKIDKILLGGSPVPTTTLTYLQKLQNTIYHSYGMTETISHVAVRNLSQGEKEYVALEGVEFSTDQEGRLIIHAPAILEKDLITNDVVELISTSKMIWKGRVDNVVNSGGVKLQVEEIEAKISEAFQGEFYLTKEEDPIFGERLIMISKEKVHPSYLEKLDKLERPKKFYVVNTFRYTENGKLLRLSPQQLSGL